MEHSQFIENYGLVIIGAMIFIIGIIAGFIIQQEFEIKNNERSKTKQE